MGRRVVWAVGIGATLWVLSAHSMPLLAHHSIAGIYDDTHRVKIEGVVTQFLFVDPHPFVVLEVKDGKGKAQRWTLAMDNRWELAELGFKAETLKPGDRIVVLGNVGRRQPRTLYIRKLDRPEDGFSYEHHP